MSVGFVNQVRYWSMRAMVECMNEGRPLCYLVQIGSKVY